MAVLKKDILTGIRYRNGFIFGLVASGAQLATFYYLSRAIGPQFRPEGMPYFVFLLVGTGFYAFLITGIHSFLRVIQESQQAGTLPVPVRLLSSLLPFTHSLTGMRLALLQLSDSAKLIREIEILFGFALCLVPLSIVFFSWTVRRARQLGSLSFY